MDNITHSIVGVIGAEILLHRTGISPSRNFRRSAWLVSCAANNLPDLDFLYAKSLDPQLGYLLHHRGYTHTLLACLPETGLLLALVWLVSYFTKTQWTKIQWKHFFILAILGCFLHIACDSFNSYGVHPFWPLNNRWIYGDILFIIEPLIWFAALPGLFFASESIFWRGIVLVFYLIAFFLMATIGKVPLFMQVTSAILCLSLFYFGKRKSRLYQNLLSATAIVGIVLFFGIQSSLCRLQIPKPIGAAKIHDVILSPFPANPFCWTVIKVISEGTTYRMQREIITPVFSLISPNDCPNFSETANWKSDLTTLRNLRAQNCLVAAFLQFSRAPLLIQEGSTITATDVRFLRGNRPAFAHFAFPSAPLECPKYIPPWTEPVAYFWNSPDN